MATKEVFKNSKGKSRRNHMAQYCSMGPPAEIIEKYTDKGSEIMVEVNLSTDHMRIKKVTKSIFQEVQIDEVLLLGDKVTTV